MHYPPVYSNRPERANTKQAIRSPGKSRHAAGNGIDPVTAMTVEEPECNLLKLLD
jgi:hypothetical protein